MKFLEGNDQLDDFMKKAFEASSAMFLMSINYLVGTTLLWNPQEMAARTSETLAAKSFKENPTREQMKNYLLASIFPRSRGRDRAPDRAKCVYMWDNIQADDQQQDVTPPTTSRRQPSTSRARSAQRAGRSSQSPVLQEMVYGEEERKEEEFQEGLLTATQKRKSATRALVTQMETRRQRSTVDDSEEEEEQFDNLLNSTILGASQKKTQRSTKCHDVEPMTDSAEEQEETGKTPTPQQHRKRHRSPEEKTTMPTSNKRKESARKGTPQKQQLVETSSDVTESTSFQSAKKK